MPFHDKYNEKTNIIVMNIIFMTNLSTLWEGEYEEKIGISPQKQQTPCALHSLVKL